MIIRVTVMMMRTVIRVSGHRAVTVTVTQARDEPGRPAGGG